jgi:hypothetical protein
MAIDCGIKYNIIRSLVSKGIKVCYAACSHVLQQFCASLIFFSSAAPIAVAASCLVVVAFGRSTESAYCCSLRLADIAEQKAALTLSMVTIVVGGRTQLTVVPWNWDIKKERYDGLFISNGPGDPAMCEETVNNLRWAIEQARTATLLIACLPFPRHGHSLEI